MPVATTTGQERGKWGLLRESHVRAGMRTISCGIAVLALGFAFKSGGTYAAASASIGFPFDRISVFGTIHPDIFRLRTPVGAQIPDHPGVRLASLDADFASYSVVEEQTGSIAPVRASFEERFTFGDGRLASFDDRFGSATGEPRNRILRRPDAPAREAARPAPGQTAAKPAPAAPKVASVPKNHFRPAEIHKDAPESAKDAAPAPEDDGHTAIYDITAHTVYMPDGSRLEAHSGLRDMLDDPRHVSVRMRGATPPHTYDLSLRESLFHGVQAIRLTPVGGEGAVFGRTGLLAHTYMLGPNGDSNGCVSFRNYDAFLQAFRAGKVKRLVVVARGGRSVLASN